MSEYQSDLRYVIEHIKSDLNNLNNLKQATMRKEYITTKTEQSI